MTQRYPIDDRTGPRPLHPDGTTTDHGRPRPVPRPPTRRPSARPAKPRSTRPQVVPVVDGSAAGDYDYVAHTTTLRGVVRHRLVTRALARHLPPAPGRVLDIGGGNGIQALALARRGYDVTVCEPDAHMLEEADRAVASATDDVRSRIRLVHGDGRDAVRLVGDGWDATLCHGVIMFVPEPASLLDVVVEATRPGGIVSVVGKNGPGLALRAGLQGRWSDVRHLLDDSDSDHRDDTGGANGAAPAPAPHLGDDPEHVKEVLTAAGTVPCAWYGIRTFTDHLGDVPPGPDVDDVVDAEWVAGERDPYRQVARLIHYVSRRERP